MIITRLYRVPISSLLRYKGSTSGVQSLAVMAAKQQILLPQNIQHANFMSLESRRPQIKRNNICSITTQAPAIHIVKYEEVKDLRNYPDKLLIDVREPKELKETGKIPTSINIPLGIVSEELAPGVNADTFKSKYGRNKPQKDTEIIFYCKLGRRSLSAAESAQVLGYKNVSSYEGSWVDWAKHEGLPE